MRKRSTGGYPSCRRVRESSAERPSSCSACAGTSSSHSIASASCARTRDVTDESADKLPPVYVGRAGTADGVGEWSVLAELDPREDAARGRKIPSGVDSCDGDEQVVGVKCGPANADLGMDRC
jgi:hypothetical protein